MHNNRRQKNHLDELEKRIAMRKYFADRLDKDAPQDHFKDRREGERVFIVYRDRPKKKTP